VRDFVVSPGFAGVVALLAAIIAAGAVLYASRRARQRFEQRREQQERREEQTRDDAANALAWERWQWVVDTAGIEPATSEGATLGLGPAVTLELLGGLLREAERLGDETLAKAVAVYQEQLLLVLAQQAGTVSDLGAPTTARTASNSNNKPASSAHRKSDTATPTTPTRQTPGETAPAAVTESGGGRRRR
jgi:F0F1-type ATP synthase epsilon subunit